MVRSAIVVGMVILLVTVSLTGCGKSTTTTTAKKQQPTSTLQQPTFKAQPTMQQQPRQPIQQPTQVNLGRRYLRYSAIPTKRFEAIALGYSPCSVCRP